jgi:hypothetical protein
MSGAGVAQFIAMVSLHFPRPKFGGDEVMEAGWMSSMTLALSKYDDGVLRDAAQHVLANRVPKRDGAFFPAPSECIAVCNTIASLRHKEAEKANLLPGPNPNEWSDERIALAFDLMRTELGRRAGRDGWLQALYTFCRKNMRLPKEGVEIQQCIRDGAIVQSVIDDFSNREPSAINGAIVQWGRTLVEKQDEMARKVGGKS